jgi:hypothetical protein
MLECYGGVEEDGVVHINAKMQVWSLVNKPLTW